MYLHENDLDLRGEKKVIDFFLKNNPIFGHKSIALFQNSDFEGRILYVPSSIALSDLGWFSFDNITTSYINFGGFRWY